jgi:hypothetical protein|nr:MAG TPA: Putative ADP-ribosyltransferase Certhrax [Caudoviricetes sp.]
MYQSKRNHQRFAWKKGEFKIHSIRDDNDIDVTPPNTTIKSFNEILKFNPYHDRRGQFASSNSFAVFSAKPGRLKHPEKYKTTPTGGESTKEHSQPSNPTSMASTTTTTATRGHISGKEYFKGVKTEKEAVEVVRKDLEKISGKMITTKEAQQMYDSVYAFTGSEYTAIRAAQSGNSSNRSAARKGEHIERFIDASPKWEGGELYRGMNISNEQAASFKASLQKGSSVSMNGVSSWSSKQSMAESYTRGSGEKFIFVLPKTKHGTSIEHLSNFPGENEVIVSSKSNFVIKNLQTKKKRGSRQAVTYVYMEETA